MNIAIIGNGRIGAGLARAWKAKGHTVVFGARKADDAELLALCQGMGATASSVSEARKVVKRLVEDVGFDALDAGPLKSARLIEPLMLLWVASSKALGSRDVAFRLLRR